MDEAFWHCRNTGVAETITQQKEKEVFQRALQWHVHAERCQISSRRACLADFRLPGRGTEEQPNADSIQISVLTGAEAVPCLQRNSVFLGQS